MVKNHYTLDDYQLKDDTHLIVEMVEKLAKAPKDEENSENGMGGKPKRPT